MRETRTLRAMWRELETGLRSHASEALPTETGSKQIGRTYGTSAPALDPTDIGFPCLSCLMAFPISQGLLLENFRNFLGKRISMSERFSERFLKQPLMTISFPKIPFLKPDFPLQHLGGGSWKHNAQRR